MNSVIVVVESELSKVNVDWRQGKNGIIKKRVCHKSMAHPLLWYARHELILMGASP